MICLRCAYCCITYDVIIVKDPAFGVRPENLTHKKGGVKCPHLLGNAPGEHSCALHDYPWYVETPCYDFTQIEKNKDCKCRMGAYIMEKIKSTSVERCENNGQPKGKS